MNRRDPAAESRLARDFGASIAGAKPGPSSPPYDSSPGDSQPQAILRVHDDWAGRALEVARSQAALPDGPGRRSEDGAVAPCAAACVARAGLELRYGADRAETFRAEVGTTGSVSTAAPSYTRWVVNDRTPSADRIAALAGLLARRPARLAGGEEPW